MKFTCGGIGVLGEGEHNITKIKMHTRQVWVIIACFYSTFLGRLIPGSVPVSTRTQSNSETLYTAPAHVLYLTTGDIYAPSIIGRGGALYLKLGQDCTITGDLLYHNRTNLIDCPNNIDGTKIVVTANDGSADSIRTLSFNITIDDRFIDGQANMMVSFAQFVNGENSSISGYLYFNSQPNAGCDSYTQPITTQCDCPTTCTSDPTQATNNSDISSLKVVTTPISGSRSMQNHLELPGSVLIVVVSLLLSAT